MKILVAQLNPTIGDFEGNLKKILKSIDEGKKRGADLILTPEMASCGYPPEDFLLLPHFLDKVEDFQQKVIEASAGITVILGTPRRGANGGEKKLFNSAAVIQNKKLLGYYDKNLLPTYDVFDERRYFSPGKEVPLWTIKGKRIALLICEDIWQHAGEVGWSDYPNDPIQKLKNDPPDLILVPSASPYSAEKPYRRLHVCAEAAKTLKCPLILANQIGGNDSLIFDGHSLYVDAHGQLLHLSRGWEEDFTLIDLEKSQSAIQWNLTPDEELYKALVLGIRDYFMKSGFKKAILGVSGGIDSAVVACLGAEALGAENILCVAMPSRYSSKGSIEDAAALAEHLKTPFKTISIEPPFKSYLSHLESHFEKHPPDATEENLQSRIRGMILMALSNKFGYILLSTGNKSELAMGYATLYGDMCGGLAVLSDITKKDVYRLARWINRNREIIPRTTIDKPPSAELRPNQKDTDSLPDYAIVDCVLKAYVEEHLPPEQIAEEYGLDLSLVLALIKKIHLNEYKRRQAPLGLRVTEKAFCIGRRFPVVQKWI